MPSRRGYSLYDSYQLSNSSAIPMYQGSAGPEVIKVGQYMQGLYDTGLGESMAIDTNLDNMSGHPNDKQIINETRDYYKGRLKELAAKGDYENLVPQVHQLGSQYANDARVISGIQQQKQEFLKGLEDKDKDLTGYQKQALASMADREYSGLRRNAQGQLTGSYTGTKVDKNIDINKWVRDNAKDIISNKYSGEAYQGTNGEWLVKTGHGVESVTPARVKQVLSEAMGNDETVKGYIDMMGRISSSQTKGMSPEQLADYSTVDGKKVPNRMKQSALELSKSQGVPFDAALAKIVYDETGNSIRNRAFNVGTGTYAFNKSSNTIDMTENSVTARKEKELADHTLTMLQGPNTVTTNDERNPAKLAQTVNELGTQVSDLDGQINRYQKILESTTLKPEERTQLESNLNNATLRKATIQDQANRANGIMSYSKMKTAQALGYVSYNDFLESESKKVLPEVKKLYPNGLDTKAGKKISAEELSKAILDGKVQGNFTSSGGTNSFGVTGSTSLTGVTVTLPDGHKVAIAADKGGARLQTIVNQATTGKGTRINEFNKLNETQHKSNVSDYTIKDNVMTLPDATSKDFTNALKAGWDGVKVKKMGSYEEVDKSDRPTDFRVVGLGTPGPNGESRLMIEGLDEKGVPTGDKFEANAINSNINEKTARFLRKQPTPEAQQAAEILTTGAASTQLKGKPLGYTASVGKVQSEGKEVNVNIVISGTESDPEYNFTAPDGKILKSTKSLGTANSWINMINKK